MRTVFELAKKKKRIEQLEKEIQRTDFWQHPKGKSLASHRADKERAIKITQELSELNKEISEFDKLKKELNDLKELSGEIGVEKEIKEFEKKLKQKELQVFLKGKYDKNNAILSIYAGAGGRDAQDWATMLLQMYEKYCLSKGYRIKILDQSFGEGGGPEGRIGTKQVCLEVKGDYAYGFLKKESGVHRLIRISPFSPKSLRHTSFALVEVLPEINKEIEEKVKIRSEDLKLETFRASGPGGQYINRRESAVRITHLPTGIKVGCQTERLQGLNRQRAMKILITKIYQLEEIKRQKELKKIKGDLTSASWGNQIRSYILYPYKMVKDIRTGIETSDVEEILEGNLEKFIQPY